MVRKLLGSSGERGKTGLFVVEGIRLFNEVPEDLIEEVFVSDRFAESERLSGRGLDLEIVEHSVFRELSDTVNPQGILAVVKQPDWKDSIDNISGDAGRMSGKVLLLDGIRDPGNMGTIIRTAEAAGVRFVAVSRDCVDVFNPKVIRATMGSIFRVPVVVTSLLPVIESLKRNGLEIYGTSLQSDNSYKDVDLSSAGIIIGSEADGISPEVMAAASQLIKIPMMGQVESLNAAISAAILMFQ